MADINRLAAVAGIGPLDGMEYIRQRGEAGRQRGQTNYLSRLAGQAFTAAPAERQAIIGQAAQHYPQQAMEMEQAFGKRDDSRIASVAQKARYIVGLAKNGQSQVAASLYPQLAQEARTLGLGEVPDQWDDSFVPGLEQLAQYGVKPGDDTTPSDIRSLQILQGNPELLRLDRERRQAAGMVPKPFETSQGIGWGTPGGGIELAPITGVAGSQAPPIQNVAGTPAQSDFAAQAGEAFYQQMIQAGLSDEQATVATGAYLTNLERSAPSFTQPQASAPPRSPMVMDPVNGGIAQPYEAPTKPPAGYEFAEDGRTLRPILGGPQDTTNAATAFKDEQSIRKEVTDAVKQDQSVLSMYQKVQEAANSNTAAGDLSLIFAFMKMLDPGSVVREQEFNNAQNAAGIPDRILNYRNQILSGVRLNPAQRADFMNQAQQIAGQSQSRITNTARRYQGISEQYGFNPERATGMPDFRGVQGGAQPREGGNTVQPVQNIRLRYNPATGAIE
ncbi:hypothetical protein [Pseudoxanthomonas koreensis]|uniref:hypothetical protein n=1 Tax=Pseudoxanthomonas koreensis TaxID=266061 RepID=UPI001391502D|nr:hypothetical protein [Pseudoxanthomonas koreensis]KAF1692651.1 hypothetical protein CSC64_06595 [Pseudoxanthomonas koreensis]